MKSKDINKLLKDDVSTPHSRCWYYFFNALKFTRILFRGRLVTKWETFQAIWEVAQGHEGRCMELIDMFLSITFKDFEFVDFHSLSNLENSKSKKLLTQYPVHEGPIHLVKLSNHQLN